MFTLVLKLLVVVRKKEIWNFCIAVTERIRENEAVKMIRLKEGFVRIAEAYVELGKKCSTVFQAQKVNTEIICILTLKGSLNITVVQWIISLQKGNKISCQACASQVNILTWRIRNRKDECLILKGYGFLNKSTVPKHI